MSYLLEICFAALITYLFYDKEKPKVKFLLYGYVAFFVVMILQIPFKFLQSYFFDYFDSNFMPATLVLLGTVIVSEVGKYFSLKKFLNTKSFKNGIFFGIGWSTIESINYFTITFFTYVLGIFGLSFSYDFFLHEYLPTLNFAFFFIFNIAITVLVILSVIKKNYFYLIYSILLSMFVYLGLELLSGVLLGLFILGVFVGSIFIIFRYRKLK